MRRTRLAQALKSAVDAGQVGDPVFLNLVRLGAPDADDRSLAALLDLAVWLMGDQPEEVQADSQVVDPVRHRSVALRFARDRVAVVELSSGGSADPFERVLLLGTLGRLLVDSAEASVLELPVDRPVLPAAGLVWDDRPGPAAPGDAAALLRAAIASAELKQPVRPETADG